MAEVSTTDNAVTVDNPEDLATNTTDYFFGRNAHVYQIARSVFFTVEALVIVSSNTLTLVAVRRSKRLRQVATNNFIVSLAMADGIIGITMPFFLWGHFSHDDHDRVLVTCLLRAPQYSMVTISLSTLLAIAVDRYLAIVHPLSYRTRMTPRRARLLSIVIWSTELLFMVSLTCYYGTRVPDKRINIAAADDLFPKLLSIVLIHLFILLPIVANVVIYTAIYINLRKREAMVSSRPEGNCDVNGVDNAPSKRTKAFTKMMALVLGYLVLAWLPYYVLAPMYKVNDPRSPAWYAFAYDAAAVLFFSNSFVNPVIYCWKNQEFREAYAKLLKCAAPDVRASRNGERTIANEGLCTRHM